MSADNMDRLAAVSGFARKVKVFPERGKLVVDHHDIRGIHAGDDLRGNASGDIIPIAVIVYHVGVTLREADISREGQGHLVRGFWLSDVDLLL